MDIEKTNELKHVLAEVLNHLEKADDKLVKAEKSVGDISTCLGGQYPLTEFCQETHKLRVELSEFISQIIHLMFVYNIIIDRNGLHHIGGD